LWEDFSALIRHVGRFVSPHKQEDPMSEYESHRKAHRHASDDGDQPDVEAHRHRLNSDDGTESTEPDVEAHRHRGRHRGATDEVESNEPDVEAHRHRGRHRGATDEPGSDQPDVEAHRFSA
jgi:hypothetical protein